MIPFEELDISNAGGMAKTLGDVRRFCNTSATRIIVGGITTKYRTGNEPVAPGDVLFLDEETGESGNAIGLKNNGTGIYRDPLREMINLAHANRKQLWVNVNGESVEDIVHLVQFCFSCGADGVEINLACPNVHDKGVQKPLFCEDPMLVRSILYELRNAGLEGRNMSVKISPTDDDALVIALCMVLTQMDIVTEVVATNTRGNQRFIRTGVDRIAFRPPGSDEVKYVGGQGGRPLHQRSVEIMGLLCENLPAHFRKTGVGGIFTGRDAFNFIELGATGIQCATATLFPKGARVLNDIAQELSEYYAAAVA